MNNFFTIDDSLCVRCGTCAETCPVKLIYFKKPGTPRSMPWASKACINCGHCVAVCPKGALSLPTMPADDCAPIMKDLAISFEQADQLLRSRRSIRTYLDKPVEKEKLEKIIRTARYAPTGHNLQDVEWTIIYDAQRVSRLKELVVEWMRKMVADDTDIAKALSLKSVIMGVDAGHDLIMRGAPHLVVTHAPKEDRMARSSCTIALAFLDLAAKAAGIGTCWAGFLDLAAANYPPVMQAMELPEGHISYGSMMVGYPKYQYYRIPTRKDPKITWK